MPEGDTVYRAAHRLDDALAGTVLTRFELRVPQAATIDLTGMTVREVVPRGKHLLHHIGEVGSSRVDLQACKLEYSIVSPK